MLEVAPSLERGLHSRGIHPNPRETVALDPKGHVPTPEDLTLLAGVGICIADEGGIQGYWGTHRH